MRWPIATAAVVIAAVAVGSPQSVTVQPAAGAAKSATKTTTTTASAPDQAAILADRAEGIVTRDTVRRQRPGTGSRVAQQAAARNEALAELASAAEQHARELRENQWVMPLAGYTVTSGFGFRWGRLHAGTDFAAPSGTPLVAVANGVVTSASYDGGYGNKTVLTLEDGTEVWYCHQTSFLADAGETVAAGDPIGTVGSTGNSTGPHLHLEIHPAGGDAVDPHDYLVERGLQP